MTVIEAIKLNNTINFLENIVEDINKCFIEAKELHKSYIAMGGCFVEDNYNDMKAYAISKLKFFAKPVRRKIKALPAACKEESVYKKALTSYREAATELLKKIEDFEIEEEEPIETASVKRQPAMEKKLVEEKKSVEEELVKKVLAEKHCVNEIGLLVRALCDLHAVVSGALEGIRELTQAIIKTDKIMKVKESIKNANIKELLCIVETWLRDFYAGKVSGENVCQRIMEILSSLYHNGHDCQTLPRTKKEITMINQMLVRAYDTVIGCLKGMCLKFDICDIQAEILKKASAVDSEELIAAANYLGDLYFNPNHAGEAKNKIIELYLQVLEEGTNDFEHR